MVNDRLVIDINNSSIEDLKDISDLIQMRKDKLGKDRMNELRVGDKVEFTTRAGKKVTGTIRKKNIKRLVVDTPAGGWNVPANMLTLTEDWD